MVHSPVFLVTSLSLDVDMEFRGFVKDGKFTALSQYNQYEKKEKNCSFVLYSVAYFPRLVQMREKILRTISDFCTTICIPALKGKFSDYIIDFGLVGDDFSQVIVIELNEFMDTTDGMNGQWCLQRLFSFFFRLPLSFFPSFSPS